MSTSDVRKSHQPPAPLSAAEQPGQAESSQVSALASGLLGAAFAFLAVTGFCCPGPDRLSCFAGMALVVALIEIQDQRRHIAAAEGCISRLTAASEKLLAEVKARNPGGRS